MAGADAADGAVLVDFSDFSDHRPVIVSVTLPSLPSPNATKYWRLRLEKLREEETRIAYVEAVTIGCVAIHNEIHEIGIEALPLEICDRLRAANRIEAIFSRFIIDTATRILGRKRVPVLPGPIQAKETSPAYQLAKAEFQLSSLHLRQLINGDGDSARIAWNRQELVERRQALNSAQLADNRRGVLEFNAMLNDLPPISRLKLMNRMRRRHASAGSALPTASADLVAHRDHFARQFTNDFGMAAEEPLLTRPSLLDMAREAAGIFDEAVVASAISRSPLGKAPGMTGVCAELLAPISHLVADTISVMFHFYHCFQVVPSSWTRALICPVPKKGDLSRISNYRPISLTEVMRKIF